MKLRLSHDTLRFRLTSDDVRTLLETGAVTSTLQLPGTESVHFGLRLAERWTFANSGLVVSGDPTLRAWCVGTDETLRVILPESVPSVTVLIERDRSSRGHD